MDKTMNMYMGFSRAFTPIEGAILIFAHTAREARKVGWNGFGFELTDEYIDFSVRRIRSSHKWLFLEADRFKLAAGIPHVIDNPRTCKMCEMWGHAEISEDGLCEDCKAEIKLS